MEPEAIKKEINYRRGNGDDGNCRDCGSMREQGRLFGSGYLNCIHIGIGTEKIYHVRRDCTCDMYWQKGD
jgi:hypothetical protein